MQNYVKNKFVILSKNFGLKHILSTENNGLYFDFNKIIPMPSELDIVCDELVMTLRNNKPLKKTLDLLSIEKNDLKNYFQSVKNYVKYGYAIGSEWRSHNWGTPENSMNNIIKGNEIKFRTAWSFPFGIYKKIHEMYPALKFYFEYVDEDAGKAGKGFLNESNILIIKQIDKKVKGK